MQTNTRPNNHKLHFANCPSFLQLVIFSLLFVCFCSCHTLQRKLLIEIPRKCLRPHTNKLWLWANNQMQCKMKANKQTNEETALLLHLITKIASNSHVLQLARRYYPIRLIDQKLYKLHKFQMNVWYFAHLNSQWAFWIILLSELLLHSIGCWRPSISWSMGRTRHTRNQTKPHRTTNWLLQTIQTETQKPLQLGYKTHFG